MVVRTKTWVWRELFAAQLRQQKAQMQEEIPQLNLPNLTRA
jgi:hypothetical protein